MTDDRDLASASIWMALGTIVSRLTGLLRLLLLLWVIGKSLDADLFNNANTIPNSLYILVAGGVFNVVLVPQLIRAMKKGDDEGDAYANRVITLGLLVLAGATVVLMLIVPLLMRVVFASRLFTPELSVQRDSAELLMLLCLPQVFFYGAYVLVGQVLNARGRFGPMMWAPIANNVLACAVLGLYAVVFGVSDGTDGYSTSEALLLGLGSTAGIALQAMVLAPYLRRTGFRFRARFDFRGVGLGHTLRLGSWTLVFIVANQVAFIVSNRLATAATTRAAEEGGEAGGSAVYEIGFLVSQVPHGVITVSLATAVMPTLAALAADKAHRRMRLELGRTTRVALIVIVPIAVAVACLGQVAATVLTSYGAVAGNTAIIGHTIQAFALAMVAFTVHYLMLRGFYADEDTRTPTFIQIAIAAVNIVVAVTLVAQVEPAHVAMVLALSYGIAYTVGSMLSTALLSRRIGTVLDHEMVRFLVRLVLAAAAAAAVMLVVDAGLDASPVDTGSVAGALITLVVASLLGVVVFLLACRALALTELRYVVTSVLRRR